MTRRTLAEIFAGQRPRRAAYSKHSTRTLTASERAEMRPRPPRAAQLRYLGLMDGIADIYERALREELLPELRRMLPDQPAPYRLDAAPGQVGSILERLRKRIVALALGAPLYAIGKELAEHADTEIRRILRIDIRENAMADLQARRFVRANTDLITRMTEGELAKVDAIVQGYLREGASYQALAERLEGAMGFTRARARLIARDQTLKANAQITRERQRSVGVTQYIWSTSHDERVRGLPGGKWEKSQARHDLLDGTIQTWGKPPITNPETGERNEPGQDYQCRCVAIPVLDQILTARDE